MKKPFYWRTLRFCSKCKMNRFFDYDMRIKHSRCIACGSSFCMPYSEVSDFKEKVMNLLNKKELLLKEQLDANNLYSIKCSISEIQWMKRKIEALLLGKKKDNKSDSFNSYQKIDN